MAYKRVHSKIVSTDIIILPPNISTGKFYLADTAELSSEDESSSRRLMPVFYTLKAGLYPGYL